MPTYSTLGPEGWEEYDEKEAWMGRSMKLTLNRDDYDWSQEKDAMEW